MKSLLAAIAAAEAAKAKWDEYAVAMRKQLDQFAARYAELQEHAAKADLDTKLAEPNAKLDAGAVKLDEHRAAGADHWEKVKERLGSAFNDLKETLEWPSQEKRRASHPPFLSPNSSCGIGED